MMPVFKSFTLELAGSSDIPVCSEIIDAVFVEYDCVFVARDEVPDFVFFEQYYAGSHRTWAPWLDDVFAPAEGSAGEASEAGNSTSSSDISASDPATASAPWKSLRSPVLFVVRRISSPEAASGDIVGCIALKFNAEGPYLSRVYLRREVRGLGLGRWMSAQMLHIARKQGFLRIHLWTDTRFEDAHRMYQKLGFTFTGDIRSLHDINNTFEWKMEASL
jgi:GNAT superfamily N-acetyltransferase